MPIQRRQRWSHRHRFYRHQEQEWIRSSKRRCYRGTHFRCYRRQSRELPAVQKWGVPRVFLQRDPIGSRSVGCRIRHREQQRLLAGEEQVMTSSQCISLVFIVILLYKFIIRARHMLFYWENDQSINTCILTLSIHKKLYVLQWENLYLQVTHTIKSWSIYYLYQY